MQTAIQGKWEITSDIIFGPNKQRIEKVIYAPMITLRNLTLTPQDEQDLRNVQPFVLTTEDVDKYAIEYTRETERRRNPLLHLRSQAQKNAQGRALFSGQDLGR